MAIYKNDITKDISFKQSLTSIAKTVSNVNFVNNGNSEDVNKISIKSGSDIPSSKNPFGFDIAKNTEYVMWTKAVPVTFSGNLTSATLTRLSDNTRIYNKQKNIKKITENYKLSLQLDRPKYRGKPKITVKDADNNTVSVTRTSGDNSTSVSYSITDINSSAVNKKGITVSTSFAKKKLNLHFSVGNGSVKAYSHPSLAGRYIISSVQYEPNTIVYYEVTMDAGYYKIGAIMAAAYEDIPEPVSTYNGYITLTDEFLNTNGVVDTDGNEDLDLYISFGRGTLDEKEYIIPYLWYRNNVIDGRIIFLSDRKNVSTPTDLLSSEYVKSNSTESQIAIPIPNDAIDIKRHIKVNINKKLYVYYAINKYDTGYYYNSDIGKDITSLGIYNGNMELYKAPYVLSYELFDSQAAVIDYFVITFDDKRKFETYKTPVTITRGDNYINKISVSYTLDGVLKTETFTSFPKSFNADRGTTVTTEAIGFTKTYRISNGAVSKTVGSSAESLKVYSKEKKVKITFNSDSLRMKQGFWAMKSIDVVYSSEVMTTYVIGQPYAVCVYVKHPEGSNAVLVNEYDIDGWTESRTSCYNGYYSNQKIPVDTGCIYYGISVSGVGTGTVERYYGAAGSTTTSDATYSYDIDNQLVYNDYIYTRSATSDFTITARPMAIPLTCNVEIRYDPRYFKYVTNQTQHLTEGYQNVEYNPARSYVGNQITPRQYYQVLHPYYGTTVYVSAVTEPYAMWSSSEQFGSCYTATGDAVYTLYKKLDPNYTFTWSSTRAGDATKASEYDSKIGEYLEYWKNDSIITTVLRGTKKSYSFIDNIKDNVINVGINNSSVYDNSTSSLEFTKTGDRITVSEMVYHTIAYASIDGGSSQPDAEHNYYEIIIGKCPDSGAINGRVYGNSAVYRSSAWKYAFSKTGNISNAVFMNPSSPGDSITYSDLQDELDAYLFVPVTFIHTKKYNSKTPDPYDGSHGSTGVSEKRYSIDESRTSISMSTVIIRYPIYFKP